MSLMRLFQDALKGDFFDFLQALPHIETKIQDDGSFADGKLVFRLKPLPPVEERHMFIKSLKVATREDLWRICHKAPCAVVEIPEIEFEIGADSKRKIDSIYNHIASAVYNLSMHVSMIGESISSDQRAKICETIESLNALLDVEKPWTFMLHDRTGLRFQPTSYCRGSDHLFVPAQLTSSVLHYGTLAIHCNIPHNRVCCPAGRTGTPPLSRGRPARRAARGRRPFRPGGAAHSSAVGPALWVQCVRGDVGCGRCLQAS